MADLHFRRGDAATAGRLYERALAINVGTYGADSTIAAESREKLAKLS
jgi:hypothetical protein